MSLAVSTERAQIVTRSGSLVANEPVTARVAAGDDAAQRAIAVYARREKSGQSEDSGAQDGFILVLLREGRWNER